MHSVGSDSMHLYGVEQRVGDEVKSYDTGHLHNERNIVDISMVELRRPVVCATIVGVGSQPAGQQGGEGVQLGSGSRVEGG